MREDGRDAWDLASYLRLQICHQCMRLAQRHLLVQFKVLLHVQTSFDLLHRNLMDGEVAPGCNCANAVMNGLGHRCSWNSVYNNVGSWKMPLHSFCRLHRELF